MVDLKALRFLNKSFIFHRSLGMFCDLYMYKRVRIKKNGNLVSDGCHSAVLYVLWLCIVVKHGNFDILLSIQESDSAWKERMKWQVPTLLWMQWFCLPFKWGSSLSVGSCCVASIGLSFLFCCLPSSKGNWKKVRQMKSLCFVYGQRDLSKQLHHFRRNSKNLFQSSDRSKPH